MEIIITLEARKKLQRIIDFLKLQQVPDEKIHEIVDRIFQRISSLADRPFLGQVESILFQHQKRHRRLIEGPYKIIYYIENNVVYVTDIFDSRQDPLSMKG